MYFYLQTAEDNKYSMPQKPSMSDVDDAPAGTSSDEMDHVRRNVVYRNYDFTKKYDLNLPITMHKDKVIKISFFYIHLFYNLVNDSD
jgi:hypothetical protein